MTAITAKTSKTQLLAIVEQLRHNLDCALTERDSAAAERDALRAKVGALNTSLDAATARMRDYEAALGGLNSKLMRDAMCPPVAPAAAADVAPWDDLPAAQAAHSEVSAPWDDAPAVYPAPVRSAPAARRTPVCFEFNPAVRGDFARASALAREHRGVVRRAAY